MSDVRHVVVAQGLRSALKAATTQSVSYDSHMSTSTVRCPCDAHLLQKLFWEGCQILPSWGGEGRNVHKAITINKW